MTTRLAALALALLPSVALAGEPPADLLLRGGTVHTLDPARPRASWVAVRGETIAALGEGAPDAAWIGSATRVIELAGACVVPGLWDAHGHLLSLGLGEREVDLVGTRSLEDVIARVAARARETPAGAWIVGRGWDQNDWPEGERELPGHAALSAAVPEHPVLLERVDGHAALINARAMAERGIGPGSQAPPGGELPRDAQGNPTGLLVDAAQDLCPTPPPSPAEVRAALLAAARRCARLGLVGVHDAGVSPGTLRALEELAAAGELPIRVYVMLAGPIPAELARGPRELAGGRLAVRAVKLFVDGALGSRGALLLEPYADRPDSRGLAQAEPEALYQDVLRAAQAGFQPCVHAIGDAGVRRVLDAFERAGRELGPAFRALRPRVEHAQVISPDDLPRFAALGALPSMQPTHCTSDMPWAEARLGPERVKGAYAWRSLLAAGVPAIPCGSDFPVEGANPLWGLHAAVTRLDPSGQSPHGPEGWFPQERLSREEALRGFSEWACFGAHQEQRGGRIAPGRWADLTVLGEDPLVCPPGRLRGVEARWTVVAGRVVYAAD